MDWNVSVSLFVSVVLGDVMKIISSHDDGSLHLGWDADTLQDSSSDRNVAGEWAFFINVSRFDGLFRSSESKSDVLEISDTGCCLFG